MSSSHPEIRELYAAHHGWLRGWLLGRLRCGFTAADLSHDTFVNILEQPAAPLHGWSGVTVVLALLGALGGILVALVIKHADGVAKALATASSVVLTTAAGHVLFNGPMSAAIVLGSLVVIVAGYTYQKV